MFTIHTIQLRVLIRKVFNLINFYIAMNFEYEIMICRRARNLSEETGSEINMIQYMKGDERYVFLYDDSSWGECLTTLGRLAEHPELKFTWYVFRF